MPISGRHVRKCVEKQGYRRNKGSQVRRNAYRPPAHFTLQSINKKTSDGIASALVSTISTIELRSDRIVEGVVVP